MNLTDISVIRSLMGGAGTGFKKGLGQNFLINPAVPRQTAEALGAEPGNVLEIGPGIGTLTAELCGAADKVVAVELDRSLIPVLEKTLAGFDNVTVINADILKTDLSALCKEHFGGGDYSVCANLPYYITSPILMYLLESGCRPKRIVIMVQKEVAQRLTAAPGSPEYGAITASVARYGTVTKLFGVPAGDFMPAPKVDSAVIRIDMYDSPPFTVKNEKTLDRVIKGAFAQRRKTLANSMSGVFAELGRSGIAEVIEKAGLPPDIRGERLSIEQMATISDIIEGMKG